MFDEIVLGTLQDTESCRRHYYFKGDRVVNALRMGDKLYVLDSGMLDPENPDHVFVSFHLIGWWSPEKSYRWWPSNHPEELEELQRLMAAARLEGKL